MRNKLKERRELIDDDGVPLTNNPHGFEVLEAAHILPHSLTRADSEANPKLSDSNIAALNILNLFDPGVVHLIEGVDIDRPLNAITMSQKMHKFFGRFEIFFEPAESSAAYHRYKIDTFYPELFSVILPVTRTLYDTDKSIDMPSPRLLAIHCAIAHILHLSGAGDGDYIDNLLRDMEHISVHPDGSTRLDEMVKLRLSGWWDGTVRS